MESKARTFKIKYVDGEPDSIVHVERSKSVQQLLDELKASKGVSAIKHIRLIASGQEILPETRISDIPGDTLHCILSDFAPQHTRPSPKRSRCQTTYDWLESLDPGVVLMWICGLALAAFWTLYLLRKDIFEDANLALLTLLTLAFLLPCFALYLSGMPTSQNAPFADHGVIVGGGSVWHESTREFHRPLIHDADTPPRPSAPLEQS